MYRPAEGSGWVASSASGARVVLLLVLGLWRLGGCAASSMNICDVRPVRAPRSVWVAHQSSPRGLAESGRSGVGFSSFSGSEGGGK